MSNFLSYKNYNGTVEYSSEDKCLFGKVIGLKSLLSYEGDSVQELEQDFQTVIDEYLEDCKERNVQPEQPYKGSFNVRISPELHRDIANYAMDHGKSLNAAVEEAISHLLNENSEPASYVSWEMHPEVRITGFEKVMSERPPLYHVEYAHMSDMNKHLLNWSFKRDENFPLVKSSGAYQIPLTARHEMAHQMLSTQNNKVDSANPVDDFMDAMSESLCDDKKEADEQANKNIAEKEGVPRKL